MPQRKHLDNYLKELGAILIIHNLKKNHPENIFNIDETWVCTRHSPKACMCYGLMSSVCYITMTNYVTIIGSGNALGKCAFP